MKMMRFLLAAIAVTGSCYTASVAAAPLDFEGTKWIWFSAGAEVPLGDLPAAVNYFRSAVTIPDGAEVKSAEVIITCDNMYVLHLNGKPVGESEANNSAWSTPERWDVAKLMVPGRNVLAVEAVNTLPGPGGLIVKLVVELADGGQIVLPSDATWMVTSSEHSGWHLLDFDDTHWNNARVVGEFGAAPWNKFAPPATAVAAGKPIGAVSSAAKQAMNVAARQGRSVFLAASEEPPADYPWPEAIVFVAEDCSLYRPVGGTGTALDSLSVTIFNPRHSRAFPEHDLPAPMKVGRKLVLLKPARPGTKPRVLLDAGRGAVGSPSVSFDGKSILVSMANDGEPFYHIYRLPAVGGRPEQLTDGPFHDIDPAELPDGRIVFTSTRIGTFEEYHSPPSRSLYVMNADGSGARPLTHTIIFDNEPEVLADGRILFIRSDNFFDRGKVETLLHAIHPDGTRGYTEFGLDIGPDYGGRLRANNVGSPAPMPDGRLAFLSGQGITIGRLGYSGREQQTFRVPAGDVAAMPDGRLLYTTGRKVPVEQVGRTVEDHRYMTIGVFDPQSSQPTAAVVYESPDRPLHSPVFLGPRPRPPLLPETVDPKRARDVRATGVFFCQNVRATKNSTAGWEHVRAIRVIAAKGLTTRSSHSYIVHAGNETIELGTVPLAPDGSFSIEVPANTPVAFQAVDAEGRSELNEMSWIYVRPGERRGCVGCHHKRQAAPLYAEPVPLAIGTRPLKLLGQGDPHRFRGNNAAVTGLMNMQFDRYREVAGINRHSETPDPSATGSQEVATLAAQLRGDNSPRKISAAQRLSIFRDLAAAPALAEALEDESREARVAAATALGACGTRESVPALLNALDDTDPLVAQAAAVALENLTGHAEPFDPFTPSQQQASQAWRQWFGGTTWAKIEQELVVRLQDADRNVVRRAAVALGHTGGDAARVALRRYVTEHRDNNPLPAWRKAGHGGDNARFNSLAEVNPRTLQAATRALGYLKDAEAIPMLTETLAQHDDPGTGNLFLAEAAVEALGRIGTPEAEDALVAAFAALSDYPGYTNWYGDHGALMACHASPVHYFIAEALDAMGSTRAQSIVSHLIRAVPVDPDRALLLCNDDCEVLTGRVIRRQGAEEAVVETCLAILGDPDAERTPEIEKAIATVHRCWGGHPRDENRAAQILSMVCRDRQYEPRIRAALDRYRATTNDIPRVFDTGIPVVLKLPVKHWVSFFLARSLGNLADRRSPNKQTTDTLIAVLELEATEAATGYPDPLGPGVLFLHNDLTPCWRAAAAWALGQIGDRRAVPALLKVVGDLKNAPDTRHAAAESLGRIADPASLDRIRRLAADYPEESTRRALLKASLQSGQDSRTAGMAGER
ncbi:MAG: HEAT repeat domain-containing protein [Planctomycetes bacterium]|nr:HEAT repeat domain-containing protein [Planctomycetota bacterium]